MINPINTETIKKHRGGGFFAKLGGGVASTLGVAAAPFTGGLSIPISEGLEAAGGAATLVGNLTDKGPTTQGKGPQPLNTALRVDPELQLAALTQAQKDAALHPDFNTDQAKQLYDYLDQAKAKLNERLRLA